MIFFFSVKKEKVGFQSLLLWHTVQRKLRLEKKINPIRLLEEKRNAVKVYVEGGAQFPVRKLQLLSLTGNYQLNNPFYSPDRLTVSGQLNTSVWHKKFEEKCETEIDVTILSKCTNTKMY